MATTRTKKPASAADKIEGGAKKALLVVPKRDGFRRAGYVFSGETRIPLSDLSPEQLEQIQGEPMLVSMVIDLPESEVAAAAEEPTA